MTTMWLALSGLVALFVGLIIAITFGLRLDRWTTRLCGVVSALLALSIAFIGMMPVIEDDGLLTFITVIASIATGLAWFFLLIAFINLVSSSVLGSSVLGNEPQSRSAPYTDKGPNI